MSYLDIIKRVSDKLNIPEEIVKKTYESYWLYIRNSISELPLKDNLSEEEFNNLRTNFNIPSIGKLSCSYDRYKAIKERYKHIKRTKDGNYNKEDKTSI